MRVEGGATAVSSDRPFFVAALSMNSGAVLTVNDDKELVLQGATIDLTSNASLIAADVFDLF